MTALLAFLTVLAAGLGLLALTLWRRLLAERLRLREEIDASPIPLVRETPAGFQVNTAARGMLSGDIHKLEDIAISVVPEHRGQLLDAISELREKGEGFDLTLDMAKGNFTCLFSGNRIKDVLIVSVEDQTAIAHLSESFADTDKTATRLHELINAVPLPMWWRDPADLRIEGCNEAYASLLGCSVGDVLSGDRELGASEIGHGGRAIAERAVRTGISQSESHHIVVGGERRLLDFTETPVGSGAVIGFARDMTDLEAVQTTLATHIAAHDELLESLGTAVMLFGPDRRLKFFNHAFLRLWGLNENMLSGMPTLGEVLELLRLRRQIPEIVDFPAFKKEQERLFTTLIEPSEELMHLPDERTLRKVIIPHPLGGLLFQFEDVTDRIALERSHYTLTAVQRETLNNLYEGVAVFGSDGRIKLWNPTYEKLWSLKPDDLKDGPHISTILDKVRDVMPASKDWEGRKKQIVVSITEPRVRTGRMVLGENRIVDFAYVPLPDGQCLVLYLDVTASVQVQRALRERNAALERADLLKSQFIANVSYELRTPLNAIVGFSEILQQKLFGNLTERQMSYVSYIHDASMQLMTLINDVLDLAGIQAGFTRLEYSVTGLVEILSPIVKENADLAKHHDLSLLLDIGKKDDIRLEVDARRLKQALSHLVANAIRFTPRGGTVRLTARRQDDTVLIEVHDTGSGIAPDSTPDEPYQRGESFGRLTGAGLGLALGKSVVELHGGSLDVTSSGGDETVVICRLPLNRPAKDFIEVEEEETLPSVLRSRTGGAKAIESHKDGDDAHKGSGKTGKKQNRNSPDR